MSKKRKILICPLDWGLGHATRLIPIIKALLKTGIYEVIIASDNYPLRLLRSEFPDLEWIKFPSYKISYSRNRSFLVLRMILQSPKIISGILKEHNTLRSIVRKKGIDIVISDNRFGLWNNDAYSIFITHQLMIKMPGWLKFLEKPVHMINKNIISRYDKCWVPDHEQEFFLSGDLSHKYPLHENTSFIGPLSRFEASDGKPAVRDLLVIISGPEPQRSIFEEVVISQLKNTKLKALIVGGRPGDADRNITENVIFRSHLPTDEMKEAIDSSEIIVSRSGYSTIMDLLKLNRKAILVPTPGQTEQEYLAEYYMKKNIFYTSSQKNFNLEEALKESRKYSPVYLNHREDLLHGEISKLNQI